MMDLYEEANLQKQKEESKAVWQGGGDLYDEAGFTKPEVREATPTEDVQPAVETKRVEPVIAPVPKQSKGASPRARRATNTRERFEREREDFLASLSPERRAQLEEINAFEAGLIGTGKGFVTIGRGLGMLEDGDDDEDRHFEELRKVQPGATTTGEVIGEAAPFVPLGLGAAAGAAKLGGGLAAKVLTTGAVGALEGGVISNGEGADALGTLQGAGLGGVIAGAFELAVPIVGRIGRKIFRKLGRTPQGPLLDADGMPTPEFKSAMAEVGVTEDQIAGEVKSFIQNQADGIDPEHAARMARFQEQGILATKGDITQEFADQSAEQRLLAITGSASSEPLRMAKLQQSEQFEGAVQNLIDDIGATGETGDAIKDALLSRKKILKSEKNALYKEVSEMSPEASQIPVVTDDIYKALPDVDTIDDISITAPDATKQFKQALARFGIDQSEEALESLPANIKPQPLTMANFDRFRKLIGNIERGDQTGAIKVLTGPVKSALDGEVDLISDAMQKAGIVDESIFKKLKEARGTVRQLKTEFSKESITGKLIGVKRDGVTPEIEASKVASQLLGKNKPIEELRRTLNSLQKSGTKGKKAIRDLQGAVILNALNDSLNAVSRKTNGVQTVGGNQFAKTLKGFDGDDGKLALLFRGDEKTLNRLKSLEQTALDISPSAAATPKGSAPILMDYMQRLGNVPGVAAVRDTVKFLVNAGSDDRAVRKALQAKPKYREIATQIEQNFPAIAAAIGISTVMNEEGEE